MACPAPLGHLLTGALPLHPSRGIASSRPREPASSGDIVGTVAATSNCIATFSLQIDLTGANATTAQVVIEIEVIWYGFLTAPVIAAA